MRRTHLFPSLAVVLLFVPIARSEPSSVPPTDDAAVLAARIDQLIETACAANGIEPAALADDAEFIRRVYLDLAGRIPRVSEVHEFLDSKSPNKRRQLVEGLLKGPHYAKHFTNIWRALLLPQNNNQRVRFLANSMENWLRPRLRDNMPYNRMVRELLTAPLASSRNGIRTNENGALTFFRANESKAENIAAAASRLFLGIKLQCAQCHNHPFASWSRNQFWQFAAFFSGIRPRQPIQGVFSPILEEPNKHAIRIPKSAKIVQARFLDGTQPNWKNGKSSRDVLAEWLTSADNPFFAKAIANRLWGHFFGIGIIEPVDDFGEANPPSHPKLLDELGQALVQHNFDLQFLMRAITASRVYQRGSRKSDSTQDDPRSFARMQLKGLTAEQIFDSLATATGYRGSRQGPGVFYRNRMEESLLSQFTNSSDKRTEVQTSILQALSLMNGKFIGDATSLERSETLAALLDAPFLDDRQRLDALYLATLARKMRPREAERLLSYVKNGDKRRALADVFWVLLNSSEFILNH